MTRRQWAALISATPLLAQATKIPPQGAPAPAQAASTPEEKLQKAYADIRETSGLLSKIEVPMDVEPAFAFRP